MRASDRVATPQRRCLDRCGVTTTCDRSRGCVRRVSPKFQLAGTADLCVPISLAILQHLFAVVISDEQRRNEDSSEIVIEDIECSRLTTPWLFNSEYVVKQARHSRVLFTRVFFHGEPCVCKSRRVRYALQNDLINSPFYERRWIVLECTVLFYIFDRGFALGQVVLLLWNVLQENELFGERVSIAKGMIRSRGCSPRVILLVSRAIEHSNICNVLQVFIDVCAWCQAHYSKDRLVSAWILIWYDNN